MQFSSNNHNLIEIMWPEFCQNMKEIVPKSNNKINGILPLLHKQTNKSSSKTAKFWPNLRKTNKEPWHVQFEKKNQYRKYQFIT